jgi:hypothetical protein
VRKEKRKEKERKRKKKKRERKAERERKGEGAREGKTNLEEDNSSWKDETRTTNSSDKVLPNMRRGLMSKLKLSSKFLSYLREDSSFVLLIFDPRILTEEEKTKRKH